MFEITVTVNGKPYDEATFEDELEKAILKSAADQVTEKIVGALSPTEARQITLDFKGSVDNFGVTINGADEIIEKATAALNED